LHGFVVFFLPRRHGDTENEQQSVEPHRLGAGHTRNPSDTRAPRDGGSAETAEKAENAESYDCQTGRSARLELKRQDAKTPRTNEREGTGGWI